jgi:hypothetical protein
MKPEFEPALLKSEELQLTTVGRKTGHESSRRVWSLIPYRSRRWKRTYR